MISRHHFGNLRFFDMSLKGKVGILHNLYL
jgi:hypothetical protein